MFDYMAGGEREFHIVWLHAWEGKLTLFVHWGGYLTAFVYMERYFIMFGMGI